MWCHKRNCLIGCMFMVCRVRDAVVVDKKTFSMHILNQTNVGSFLSDTELKPWLAEWFGATVLGRSYSLYTLPSYSNHFGQNDMVKLFFRRRKIVRTERQWCTRSVLQLQEVVDALVAWAKEWQLSISVNECCVLNVGKSHVWYLRQYWRHSFFLVIWLLQFYMICHLRCT